MEFLIGRNYTNVSIGDTPNNEYLSVMVSPTDFENMRYGGAVCANDAMRFQNGYLTFFRINPAYRERFEDSFTYCNDEATLVAYVEGNVVYIVMEAKDQPLLSPRDYSALGQRQTEISELKVVG